MERPQYLIDTNAVIDYFGQHMPAKGLEFMDAVFDQIPNVSVVTKIEVLGFTMPDEHYQLLTNFINDAIIFDLNKDVVDASIDVRKHHKIKLPDAIIAATAIVYDLTIITRNVKDFARIQNIKTIDPHSL